MLGHPKTDDPAYGWVRGLKREGERLFAQIAQVPASLSQAVQTGLYRYVSMALHPGGKRLRGRGAGAARVIGVKVHASVIPEPGAQRAMAKNDRDQYYRQNRADSTLQLR